MVLRDVSTAVVLSVTPWPSIIDAEKSTAVRAPELPSAELPFRWIDGGGRPIAILLTDVQLVQLGADFSHELSVCFERL